MPVPPATQTTRTTVRDRHVLTQYLGMLGARQRLMPYLRPVCRSPSATGCCCAPTG